MENIPETSGNLLQRREDIQFVVGNPPYITYQELREEDRTIVRQNFKVCEKGKFDYCYAFIEKSIRCLNKDGKMAYLIPGSIFKTVFGKSFVDSLSHIYRKYMITQKTECLMMRW